MRKALFIIFIVLLGNKSFSQSCFLTPSDTLNPKRLTLVAGTTAAVYGTSLVVLSQAWYKEHWHGGFHFFNDGGEWLQVDKVGHVYTAYGEARLTGDALKWAGMKQDKAALYGTLTGLVFQTTLEVMDGFSSKWGFSVYDMAANAGGGLLYLAQELTWKEQRITMKFSTSPAKSGNPVIEQRRKDLFGSSFAEQALKDYNGQTYWLSFNIQSLTQIEGFPKWLNIAAGYSGEGLLGGYTNNWKVNDIVANPGHVQRMRQYYLSPDIDFTRIKTKSPILKTLFSILNIVKVPAPALMIDCNNKIRGYWIFF